MANFKAHKQSSSAKQKFERSIEHDTGLPLGHLRQIPGVGPATEGDFLSLDYPTVESLRDADPQTLYDDMCVIQKQKLDRCVLYVFRCAVYYATTPCAAHEPERLKWWNWKE